jgi:predicted secreted protein
MDQVEEDLTGIRITGWRERAEDREEWSKIVEQTKTHPGL